MSIKLSGIAGQFFCFYPEQYKFYIKYIAFTIRFVAECK